MWKRRKPTFAVKPVYWLAFALSGIILIGFAWRQSTTIAGSLVVNPFPSPTGTVYWWNHYIPSNYYLHIYTFTGQVSRGQKFKHIIKPDLVFCLLPGSISPKYNNTGWSMIISDKLEGDCGDNFAPIVNPPYYGNLLFDIYGYHFRNAASTGDNDGSVNAPQKEREFVFLLNQEDFDTVLHQHRCSRWGLDCPPNDPDGKSFDLSKISGGVGKLMITDLKLGNLVPNDEAWIEQMAFKVEIYLP
jgi:hypothetical protein